MGRCARAVVGGVGAWQFARARARSIRIHISVQGPEIPMSQPGTDSLARGYGNRVLLPIAGHDPIAQDLVRGLHRIGVDDEFLLARVLGDQFQAKLEILESLRA